MKIWNAMPLPLILAAVAAAVCLIGPETARAQNAPSARAARSAVDVATSQSRFGVRVLTRAALDRPTDNAIVSPLSLVAGLGLLSEGADERARAAIAKTLSLPATVSAGDEAASLIRLAQTRRTDVTTRFGSGVWANNGFEFNPKFRQAVEAVGAPIAVRSFSDPATRREINARFSEITEGKIPELVGSLSGDGRLILANALYFLGKWSHPFDEKATSRSSFTDLAQVRRTVSMMRMRDSAFSYRASKTLQAVELGYGSNDTKMTVLLPSQPGRKGLNAALRSLARDPSWLTGEGYRPRPGDLALPKFSVSARSDMLKSLTSLGLSGAMRPDAFRGVGQPNATITAIAHQVTLSVDEKGSEAAAGTAIMMGRSAVIAPPFQMHCDRPFIVAVREQSSGALLLLGLIVRADESRS